MSLKSVTFEADEQSLTTIDEIAANMGVDRSTVLREAIAMYLADYEDLKAQLEDSLAQIDAGNFLTHEEVMARHHARAQSNQAA